MLRRQNPRPRLDWADWALFACGSRNLCHQAIFADDATHVVMPPDPEMIQVSDATRHAPARPRPRARCGRSVGPRAQPYHGSAPVPCHSAAVRAGSDALPLFRDYVRLSRNLGGTPSLVGKRPGKYRLVTGRSAYE